MINEIEIKHKVLLDEAIKIMDSIVDKLHNFEHIKDVLFFSNLIMDKLNFQDKETIIIAAYWHDVGRIEKAEGHELLSAQMLREKMQELKYDENLIAKCENAIKFHRWNMHPNTTEGLIIRDADKLAWIGINKWKECLKYNTKMDSIIDLLPQLRNEILYFNESRETFDEEIINLLKLLIEKFT